MERVFDMFQKHLASRIALAVTAACAANLATAQDELEQTIVTATRTPRALDSVGTPVLVISRNDIERSLASDVSEILQQQAGLEIARNGGPGQTTSLFTRGTESNHTVVLVDGVRINPGTIGGAALQNIAPESLERIEIVKGPARRCTAPMPSAAWCSCSPAAPTRPAPAPAPPTAATPRSSCSVTPPGRAIA